MSSSLIRISALAAIATLVAHPALARDQVRAVGSSTVFPFTTIAAEQFGQAGQFKTPIIESTGTGGGFKLFCEGVGKDKADINNASRAMKDSERTLCAKNGVTDVVEIPIGYDGIVLASKKGVPLLNLSKKQLFLALARELPGKDGKLVANPNAKWKDVDASLPDQPIVVYGPPPTSGTRDSFVELVMEEGCKTVDGMVAAVPDEKERIKTCHLIREDGKYVDSGEDDNIIVQKLVSDPQAMGVFGYSFYIENPAKVEAHKIEGIAPDTASIQSGKYSVSRKLFVYLKKQHVGTVPGLLEFIQELTADHAVGKKGYIVAKGLLPLHEDELKATQAVVAKLAKK